MRKSSVIWPVLCVLLSAGIWLIHNLSQSYTNVIGLRIVAESNIAGRSAVSSSDALITAQVRASGFRQFRLGIMATHPRKVRFSPLDFSYDKKTDTYTLLSASLYKYASDIFGDEVTLEGLVSSEPEFTFARESYKKVPIQRVQELSFAPQYMALGSMRLASDSVLVYGELSKLDAVERVLTHPIELHSLSGNARGEVRLETPQGMRLSAESVAYSLDVTRCVELTAELPVQARGVPAGLELKVLPSSVRIRLKCSFPVVSNPCEKLSVYVDYKDFARSLSGRMIPELEGLTSSVISYSLSPEVLECMSAKAGTL